MVNDLPLSPLGQLMLGYAAPQQRPLHRLCWALDARLAGIFKSVRDPGLAAIRYAWWRDALVQDDHSKGRGDPLVDAWRAYGVTPTHRALQEQMIDGWAHLIGLERFDDQPLRCFAEARGAGLFTLLASAEVPPSNTPLRDAGALWALWDLAGRVARDDAAQTCLDVAATYAAGAMQRELAASKPIRLMTRLACADVRRRRLPKQGFELRHYLHILVLGPFL